MDTRLLALLDAHRGAVRVSEIQRSNVSRRAVQAEVLAGTLRKAARGVYASAQAPQWWAEARSRGVDLACISEAEVLGLWTFNPDGRIHVSHTGGCNEDLPAVVHRRRAKGPMALIKQCSDCLGELGALIIAESAVAKGLVTFAEVRNASARASFKFRRVASLLATGSESMPETVARYVLVQNGHTVQLQKHIPGAGRLDLWVDGVLGIEVDGREHHSSDRAFAEDRRRDNAYVVAGVPVIRVTYAQVVYHPAEFIAEVRRALAAHRRRPS